MTTPPKRCPQCGRVLLEEPELPILTTVNVDLVCPIHGRQFTISTRTDL